MLVVDNAEHEHIALDAGKASCFCVDDSARAHKAAAAADAAAAAAAAAAVLLRCCWFLVGKWKLILYLW
jgi:hypothetical protein